MFVKMVKRKKTFFIKTFNDLTSNLRKTLWTEHSLDAMDRGRTKFPRASLGYTT